VSELEQFLDLTGFRQDLEKEYICGLVATLSWLCIRGDKLQEPGAFLKQNILHQIKDLRHATQHQRKLNKIKTESDKKEFHKTV
jgi:hypothetical protein